MEHRRARDGLLPGGGAVIGSRVCVFTFMTLVCVVLPVAVFFAVGPSFWLVLVSLVYRQARGAGFGEGLGYQSALQFDRAVYAGLLAWHGVYAWLCRGVAPSAWVGALVLSMVCVRGGRFDARSRSIWAIMLFLWLSMLYRALNPTGTVMSIFHIGCGCSPD
jgi:hypothetical protein